LGNILAPLEFKTDVYWQPFPLFSMYHRHIEKNARHGKLIHEGPLSLHLEECGSFIILTDDGIDCYTLLGIIHMHYRAVDRECHEYISNPRENSYRSLHTQITFSSG